MPHAHLKKYLVMLKICPLWNEYSGSLPSLHNTKYAKFTAPLLYTLYLPQAFPLLSPLHLPFLFTRSSHSSFYCLVMLPTFSSFLSPPSSAFCCFSKYFSSFFSLSYLIYFHLSSAAFFSYLYPSIFPSEPSLFPLSPCSLKAVPATLCSQYPLI